MHQVSHHFSASAAEVYMVGPCMVYKACMRLECDEQHSGHVSQVALVASSGHVLVHGSTLGSKVQRCLYT